MGLILYCVYVFLSILAIMLSYRHFSAWFMGDPLPPYGTRRKRGITIVKPCKGNSEQLRRALSTFIRPYTHPDDELILCFESEYDIAKLAAHQVVDDLKHCTDAKIHFVVQPYQLGVNPKINNIYCAIRAKAKNDTIWLSDDNAIYPDLGFWLIEQAFNPEKVGILTAIIVSRHARSFWSEVDAEFLHSFCMKGFFLLRFLGLPLVLGKHMVFSKKVFEAHHILEKISKKMAEDYESAQIIHKLKYEIRLMPVPVSQYTPELTFKEFFSRHLRWTKLRRVNKPIAFCFEPLLYPIVIFPLLFWQIGWPAISFLTVAVLLDASFTATLDVKFHLKAYFTKQLLLPVVWAAAFWGKEITWKEKKFDSSAGLQNA